MFRFASSWTARLPLPILLALAVAIAVPVTARGQAVSGTILGTVADTTGAVLPGVTVTLTHKETGLTRTLTTDASGDFAAPSLPTGTYSVKAELSGFKAVTLSELHLGVDQRVRVDPKLEIGQMTEAVEITASVPLVQTSSSDLSTTVSEEQIKTLPLNGRNFVSLTRTIPGVLRGIPARTSTARAASPGGRRRPSRRTASGRATTTTCSTAWTTTRPGSRPSSSSRASTRSMSSSCRRAGIPRSSAGRSAAS